VIGIEQLHNTTIILHIVTDTYQIDSVVRRQLYELFRRLVPESLGSCLWFP
jgi:hypothetical protein